MKRRRGLLAAIAVTQSAQDAAPTKTDGFTVAPALSRGLATLSKTVNRRFLTNKQQPTNNAFAFYP